ncbi:MAG: S8 family serine peptidase, partial [Myxococcales bacterium]|nr:S8 family serine peptidase [Myxococcales bacterium]
MARAAQSLNSIAGFDAELCPGSLMVGTVSSEETCPSSSGIWEYEPLFPGSTGVLARHCVYRWTGPGDAPTEADLDSLPSKGTIPGKHWLDPDCMIVAANSGPDPYHTVKDNLHDAYMAQVAAPATLPALLSPVRIGVVDSRPEVPPVNLSDQLGHGLGMITLMQNILCDPIVGTCPFVFKPELALNLETRFDSNQQKGGFFGSQVRLARQIHQSVTSWQAQGSGAPLVVHLAIGWNPELSVDGSNNLSEAVVGVRRAIEYATCSGALVIAAAGNASGPLGANGPLHPAAWEQEATTCNGGPSRPLLYSVGGVDNTDAPLYNTRPGGRPRLAAPAFLATPDHPSSRELGPFTGSSPAVAVATAAAALIWSYNPGLSPETVMDRVYQYSTVELDETADYCYASQCDKIRRISICDIVKALVSPMPFQCNTPGKGTGQNPTLTTGELSHLADLAALQGQPFGG